MFLLHSLQSPINIGMILRTAEVFGQGVTIFDPHNVVSGDNLSTIADFGCGSFGRRPPFVSDNIKDCLARAEGRLIATSLGANSEPMGGFVWQRKDCIIFGNEYDGLGDETARGADHRIWVPVPPGFLPKPRSRSPIDPARSAGVANDGSVSLNVAATAAIVAHSIFVATIP